MKRSIRSSLADTLRGGAAGQSASHILTKFDMLWSRYRDTMLSMGVYELIDLLVNSESCLSGRSHPFLS